MSKLINNNIRFICNSDDNLMSLYGLEELYHTGRKPIIFIKNYNNKLFINRKKILDNAPNNFNLVKNYEGFWYDNNIHLPYIAEYTFKENKVIENGIYKPEDITYEKLANSILNLIEKAHLKDVDIIGAGTGGSIGLLCSKSNKIDKVSAVCPNIPYTYIKNENTKFLTNLVSKIIKTNLNYPFINEIYNDPNKLNELIDSTKCYIETGNISKITSHNIINIIKEITMLIQATSIKKQTGFSSDGLIVVDEKYFQNLKIPYELANENYHIYCDNKEHILKKAYNNLNKIK